MDVPCGKRALRISMLSQEDGETQLQQCVVCRGIADQGCDISNITIPPFMTTLLALSCMLSSDVVISTCQAGVCLHLQTTADLIACKKQRLQHNNIKGLVLQMLNETLWSCNSLMTGATSPPGAPPQIKQSKTTNASRQDEQRRQQSPWLAALVENFKAGVHSYASF